MRIFAGLARNDWTAGRTLGGFIIRLDWLVLAVVLVLVLDFTRVFEEEDRFWCFSD